MKFIIPTLLTIVTIASAAVLAPALPIDLLSNPTLSSQPSLFSPTPSLLQAPSEPSSNLSLPYLSLPDNRFKLRIAFSAPLLPINSALMNILYFMSGVAEQGFVNQLPPRSYSTPNYRDIQITSSAWTEARFLLWGIYYAAYDMIKLARFNDVMIELYWEDRLVGKVQVAGKRALSPVGGASNLTQDLEEGLAQPNSTGSHEDTTQPKPAVGNVTDSGLAPPTFSHINASNALSLPSSFRVSFESIAGAGQVDRNDVFLTFYAALLHVAQFPAGTQMQTFHSVSPNGKLHLHMQGIGIGCPVSRE